MEQNSQSQDRKIVPKKSHYSGKKKKHTVQNQITVNLDRVIIHKSTHSPGSHHDYKIYKTKHPVLSEELLQFYDLGYLGIQRLSRPNQHYTIQEKEEQRVERISKGVEQIPI